MTQCGLPRCFAKYFAHPSLIVIIMSSRLANTCIYIQAWSIKIWKTMLVFAYYNIFIDYLVNGWRKNIEIVKNLIYSLCLFSNGQHVTVMWLVLSAVKMDEEPVSDIMPSYSPIQTSSRNNMTVTIVGKVRCFHV